MLLFFFTGAAIIVYLNQPGYQPRERDYAYVGSFYAFAVWIGLAVPYFVEQASRWNTKLLKDILVASAVVAFIFLFSIVVSGYDGAAALTVAVGFLALFAAVAAGLPLRVEAAKKSYSDHLCCISCLYVGSRVNGRPGMG